MAQEQLTPIMKLYDYDEDSGRWLLNGDNPEILTDRIMMVYWGNPYSRDHCCMTGWIRNIDEGLLEVERLVADLPFKLRTRAGIDNETVAEVLMSERPSPSSPTIVQSNDFARGYEMLLLNSTGETYVKAAFTALSVLRKFDSHDIHFPDIVMFGDFMNDPIETTCRELNRGLFDTDISDALLWIFYVLRELAIRDGIDFDLFSAAYTEYGYVRHFVLKK